MGAANPLSEAAPGARLGKSDSSGRATSFVVDVDVEA